MRVPFIKLVRFDTIKHLISVSSSSTPARINSNTSIININTASAMQLQSLKGIGPAKANSIIEKRPFSRVEELLNVKGIGQKTLDGLRSQITVSDDLLSDQPTWIGTNSLHNERDEKEHSQDDSVYEGAHTEDEDDDTMQGNTVIQSVAQRPAQLLPSASSLIVLININTASAIQLQTLKGIGPAKANSIIEKRPFASIDDLINVKGIGQKTLDSLRSQVTV